MHDVSSWILDYTKHFGIMLNENDIHGVLFGLWFQDINMWHRPNNGLPNSEDKQNRSMPNLLTTVHLYDIIVYEYY